MVYLKPKMKVEVVCQNVHRRPPVITFEAELRGENGIQTIHLLERCEGCRGVDCPKETHIKPESDGRYYVIFCS